MSLQTTTNITYISQPGKDYDAALTFLSALPVIGLDTETTGSDPLLNQVLLISIGNQYKQFVFDVAKLEKHLDPLRKLISDPAKLFILHNAKFDYKFLKRNLNIVVENIFDTMLAEMLLLKGRKAIDLEFDEASEKPAIKKQKKTGFALDDVADKYLSVKLNKDIRITFIKMKYGDSFSKDQIYYSGMDVQYLDLIRRKQVELIQKYSLQTVCEIEMQAIPPTGDMELNGMYLSAAKWSKAETNAILDREQARTELDKLFIPIVGRDMFDHADINYNSPKQLLPAMKTIIGPKVDNLESTAESALKVLLSSGVYTRLQKGNEGIGILNTLTEPCDKVIAALLIYREKEKRITTYGNSFLNNIHVATSRIHSEFNQLFTDTGRFSSNSPNLQNIPRDKAYREAFTAWHPDYRIVGCDYSGMELRILADLSGEPSWIDCFKRSGDLHSENGSDLLGVPIRKPGTNGPTDPGENWELRQPIKSLNFGISYGMGPQKLSRETGMEYEKAKELIKKFWRRYSKIKAYFDKHVATCMEQKCVRSPYDGRLRWLEGFDYDSPKDLSSVRNLCMNFPMQAGNATITKHALYLIRKHLMGKDAKIISTVHDEILVEAHQSIAEEVLQIVRNDMIKAGERFIKTVPVDVESHVSTHWMK